MKKIVNIPRPRAWGKQSQLALRLNVGDAVIFDDEIKAQTFARILFRYGRKASRRKVGKKTFQVWRME